MSAPFSPRIYPSESSLNYLHHGIDRGRKMRAFANGVLPLGKSSLVLDAGCGYAGTAIAFAEEYRTVGIDVAPDRLALASGRCRERQAARASLCAGDVLALPFSSGVFDLVILNGVLEWVGVGNSGTAPRRVQLAVLREAWRVLAEGGGLYLGIENRWFPAWVARDPHVGLPLVAVLPRTLANALSRALAKQPYATHLYSYWGLADLLRDAGFRSLDSYVPFPHYHAPWAMVSAHKNVDLAVSAWRFPPPPPSGPFMAQAQGTHPRLKKAYFLALGLLGLQRVLAPSFVVVATKTY